MGSGFLFGAWGAAFGSVGWVVVVVCDMGDWDQGSWEVVSVVEGDDQRMLDAELDCERRFGGSCWIGVLGVC